MLSSSANGVIQKLFENSRQLRSFFLFASVLINHISKPCELFSNEPIHNEVSRVQYIYCRLENLLISKADLLNKFHIEVNQVNFYFHFNC